jgi:hypothetical protein
MHEMEGLPANSEPTRGAEIRERTAKTGLYQLKQRQ